MITKRQNFVTEAVSRVREIEEETERLKQIKAERIPQARSPESEPTLSFKPFEGFRDEVTAQLPKAETKKLINIPEGAGARRVSFETSERAAVTA